MYLHLKITGIALLILGCIHIIFPRYFRWKQEMAALSLINRQLMYVHTLFIAITIFLMGILCLTCTDDIIYTRLGKQLSLGLFIFWVIRLLVQFFYYSPSLWKGKRFESGVHILFSLLWCYFSIVFLVIYLDKL